MALKVPRCARCPGACELKTLPSVSAEDGPLKLSMLALPVFRCPKDHSAPVHGDFMIWLIQQIRAQEGGIAAGKELAAKSERRQAFPCELKYEELAPFRLDLEMPMYKCTGCGKEQIRSTKDLHARVPEAMVGINDGAGFPHSG